MLVITFGFAESTPPGVHAGCENQRLALHILKLQNFVPEHIERRILINSVQPGVPQVTIIYL